MHCVGLSSSRVAGSRHPARVSTAPTGRAPLTLNSRLVTPRASNAAASTETSQAMLQTVHSWFDSLHAADHPLQNLVHRDCHLIDNTNQACYAGYNAIKHRMQRVHEVLPQLVEASDVADAAHHAVAAHWVAQPTTDKGEAAAGTYVFKFDNKGLIIEIISYPDAPEDEYLDA